MERTGSISAPALLALPAMLALSLGPLADKTRFLPQMKEMRKRNDLLLIACSRGLYSDVSLPGLPSRSLHSACMEPTRSDQGFFLPMKALLTPFRPVCRLRN